MLSSPLITVLTVVCNDGVGLMSTISSISGQAYKNIEFIVIDGGSVDNTLEIIKSHESEIDKWISEPDSGIYDAMNKGISMATGEWIIFMNAGDTFYDEKILESIFKSKIQEKIVFGKSLSVYGDYSVLRYDDFEFEDDTWYLRKMPNHQAVFFHRDVYGKQRYDLSYKYAADTDYLRRAFSQVDYRYVDEIISVFNLGGRSNYYGDLESFLAFTADIIKLDGFSLPTYLAYWLNFFLQRILGKSLYMSLYVKYIVKK